MFRRLTMAFFRLYLKYLVSSYTRLIMGCIQCGVGGEVGARSRMCCGGWGGVGIWGSVILCYVYVC